ncbi:hypothetical protein G3A43_07970 [Paraburkholderia aspalathi]|nr:hypothetical protein [Paraburkholderia aspalathi]MBK3780192.1 hypothetical protein [Paraburkholderia aspalathi]
MEFLQFVFQNFWHFIGTVILLCVVSGGAAQVLFGIAATIRAVRKS